MKTTRAAALVSATALSLLLAGCGSESQTSSSTSTTAPGTAAAGSSTAVETTGAASSGAKPAHLDAKTQGLVVSSKGPEANTLSVYIDPQCPICKSIEGEVGAPMQKAVTANTVRVLLHPMNFLDDNLKNSSSTTMANALTCATDIDGMGLKYMAAMFELQPAKEGDGYPEDAPAKAADKAGITGADRTTFDACVKDGKYTEWVKAAQAQYQADGVNGTPTYVHNGTKLVTSEMTLQEFEKMLAGEK